MFCLFVHLLLLSAIYYFAAFTGRDIVIADHSIIGEMCSIIVCGFPFLSEMVAAFPNILTPENIRHSENIKVMDMSRFIEGTKDVSAPIVTGWGYKSTSDWWVYFNTTVNCVKKITGCDLGDIPCADRHAYQRLVRGPFKTSLSADEEKRIHGVPAHIKHAVLALPHAYAPRLDAAIHLRAQFHGFERLADIADPEYAKEVSDWLNSSECSMVFESISNKLVESLTETRGQQNMTLADGPSFVYLASDNEEIKEALATILENPNSTVPIQVMRVKSRFIHHVKNLAGMKHATNNEGLLDLIFDWYTLTLANLIFAWRKGSTSMVSTFVHSAQRVSGTTERTNTQVAVGRGGLGTRGLQLTKDRRGNPRWEYMWHYTFLEDFVI